MCWGTFDDGAGWTNVRDPRAFDVFGSDWSQMIVDTSACVLRKSDRSVSCWGYANTQPTTITGFGTDVVHLDLEFRTVCVVKSGGTVMCKTDDAAPRAMTGVTDAVKVGPAARSQRARRSRGRHGRGRRRPRLVRRTTAARSAP